MATEVEGRIDDLVSRICSDVLQCRQFKEHFQTFLTKVEVPIGWEEKGYRLGEDHPTYKYRLQILRNFVDTIKTSEGFYLTNDTPKQFCDKLKQYSDSKIDDSFPDSVHDERSQHIDLFDQNVKLQGVVVRKSEKIRKASLLIIKDNHSKQRGHASSFAMSVELIVNLHNEDGAVEGFPLKVSVGDIVEVTKCRRKEGIAWEPEIIKCYSLSETEIQSFLNHLSSCVQSEGSTAAVTEITRCRAAWDYVLDVEKCKDQMTHQILKIIDKICSGAPMSHTVSGIVEGFQKSVFFRSTLPEFIGRMTEESNISMVQKILKHVITVIPASGLQVMPMATVLAHNLVERSADLQTAKDNGRSAVDFLVKLSTIVASEVPGARQDITELPWKELPLIPVADEIKKPRLKTDDLPVIRKEGRYESEEEYLNTYFRLLREECFYKLRKGVSDFVENGQKCDSKDMMMYRILLRAASTCHEDHPTIMLISLEYEVPKSQDTNQCEDTSWLLYGNLLCISLDGSFQEPVWAVVEKHIADQRIVQITLCDKANDIPEPQFIVRMQEITNKDKRAFMAESQTFYVSYAPAMEVLQHRDQVPFKEFLVYPGRTHMKPAEYIHKIKHPPDWGIIFQKDSLPDSSHKDVDQSAGYSLLKDFEGLKFSGNCKSILDDTQLTAVELALKNKLVLIQGPPGTGKSFVGVALVRLLLSMNVPQDHGPILVVTYKNHALNNFLKDCLRNVSAPDVKIVRVGRLDEEEDELKKCLLREVGHPWPERLYKQKRALRGKIWALQPKVREAFEKLRSSNVFTADMFLKEASEDQLKCLLVGYKEKKVTEAEVMKLINEQPKNQARLKALVDKALKDWLPSQEVFDNLFAGKEESSLQENSSAGKDKQKSKEDQDQSENPSDFKDPSVEQKERFLATDEDIADEEDKEIATALPLPQVSTPQVSPSRQCLRNLICIDETKVEPFRYLLDVSKVWELDNDEIVKLVYVLQNNYFSKASSEFLTVSKDYAQLHHQLKELTNQRDIEVMKKCHVIGMTVTGATMRANLLADIKPSVMIVEEAAEILEGQLVAVIPPSVQHLIMIGDHKQLKPSVHFQRLKKRHHLDLSMFERLVNCKLPFKQLGYQCRMRDEFVDLLRELKIYEELKTNDKLVKYNDPPSCVTSTMYFWTHTKWESDSTASHSKRNSREAREITEVAKTFCEKGGVSPSKITVLCSYRGQVQEVRQQFQSTKLDALQDITVTTIDSFQGQENDIILISLVRSNQLTQGKIGYLSSMNRLCVAISRARCGLYLFGNHTHLAEASRKGWKVVSDFLRKKRCLGTIFPFRSSEDSNQPRQTERQFDGSSPARELETGRNHGNVIVNVTANQANINIAGNNSVNTINANPGSLPSVATPPPPLDIPPLGRRNVPVYYPTSPPPGYSEESTPSQETGVPTKDARIPTQETSTPIKEARRPTQEEGSATKEGGLLAQEAGTPTEETGTPDKEARTPTQEEGSPTKEGGLLAPEAGTPTEETGTPDKEARTPTQEEGSPTKEGGLLAPEAGTPTEETGTPDKEARTPTQEEGSPTKEGGLLAQEAGTPTEETGTPDKEARTPTQEEGSPTKEGGLLAPEAGTPTEETGTPDKEARTPTQEEGSPSKEGGLPAQEADTPTQETGTSVKEVTEETGTPVKEARTPIQEEGSPTKEAGLHAQEAGTPTQEATQEAGTPTQEDKVPTTEARIPTQESGRPITEASTLTREGGTPTLEACTPTQDTEVPTKEAGISTQEIDSPIMEVRTPTQEAATPTQETEVPTKEAGISTQEIDSPIMEVRTPTQEAATPTQETEVPTKEARIPTQETCSPIKEAGAPIQEDGKPIRETRLPSEDARSPTLESLDADKSLDLTEMENLKERPVQESASPKSSVKTTHQSETTGLEQSTSEEICKGKTVEETEESKGKKDAPMERPEEVFEGKPLQETRSSEVESEAPREDALPTQETMAAGKGPFEETGLEVGVKGHPTDELE